MFNIQSNSHLYFSPFAGILFYTILPTSRHAKCTEIAIEAGAEGDNIANDGMPLLVLACQESKENEKICQLLLEHKADANSVHPVSRTVFWGKSDGKARRWRGGGDRGYFQPCQNTALINRVYYVLSVGGFRGGIRVGTELSTRSNMHPLW